MQQKFLDNFFWYSLEYLIVFMWQLLHKIISLHVPWGCTAALWAGALCLCSTVHTQNSWILMPGCTQMCPPGRSWTASLTLGCLTGAWITRPCPLMRTGVWPPPFYLLPPGLSILLLRLIYAALPSTSRVFCCSVLLCRSALSTQCHHIPIILPWTLFISSATKFIPCHVQADYYKGMNMLRQSPTPNMLLC